MDKESDSLMLLLDARWYNNKYLPGDIYYNQPAKHYLEHGSRAGLQPSHWIANINLLRLVKESGLQILFKAKIHELCFMDALPGVVRLVVEGIEYFSGSKAVRLLGFKDFLSSRPAEMLYALEVIQIAFGLPHSQVCQCSTMADLMHSIINHQSYPSWFNAKRVKEINPDLSGLADHDLYLYLLENLNQGRSLDRFHHLAPCGFEDLIEISPDIDMDILRSIQSMPRILQELEAPFKVDRSNSICLNFGIVVYNQNPTEIQKILASIFKACRFASDVYTAEIARCAVTVYVNSDQYNAVGLSQFTPYQDNLLISIIESPHGNVGFGRAHNFIVESLDLSCLGQHIYIPINPDGVLHPESILSLISYVLNEGIDGKACDFLHLPVPHPKYYNPLTFETTWLSGACFAITVEDYKRIGGFDESLFLYCEDVDFSIRARSIGMQLKTLPSCKFWHDISNRMPSGRDLVMKSSAVYLARKYAHPSYVNYFKIMSCEQSDCHAGHSSLPAVQQNLGTVSYSNESLGVSSSYQTLKPILAETLRNGLHFGKSRSFK